jgi:hypothetical protein
MACGLVSLQRCEASHLLTLSGAGHIAYGNNSCVPIPCYQPVYCCLTPYLSGRALLSVSPTEAKDFDELWRRQNKHSAREYKKFAPAQLLHNWREQRPSNQADLDLFVTGKVSVPLYTTVVWLHFRSDTLCNDFILQLGTDTNMYVFFSDFTSGPTSGFVVPTGSDGPRFNTACPAPSNDTAL